MKSKSEKEMDKYNDATGVGKVLLFGNGGIHLPSSDPCLAIFLMLQKLTL